MLNLQDYTCPVCGGAFHSEENVVFCPDCGAPHHRECWKKADRCAFADTHGTPEQWKPEPSRADEDAVICGNCGAANPPGQTVCRKCGRPFDETTFPRPEDQQPPVDPNAFTPPFNPYGEVPADGVIGSQTAMDMATFIGPRTGYYLPRFQYLEKSTGRVSWNWAAALFPAEWLLYRKMYRPFLIVLAVSVLLCLPALAITVSRYLALAGDTAAMQAFLSEGTIPAADIPGWLYALSQLSSLLSLSLRGIMGLKGNDIYRRHAERQMEQIRRECGEPLYYRYALAKKGGVTLGGVIGYLCALAAAAIGGALLTVFLIF